MLQWSKMTSFLSQICAAWWIVSVTLLGLTVLGGLAQPFVQRRRATRRDRPAVTAILPVRSLDPGFLRAEESVFVQAYPDYEVLFSAAETRSAALAAARDIAARYPERASRFFFSPGVGAVSPKLDVLAAPLAAARYEFVLTKDSNVTLDPGALAAMMQSFCGRIGLVVAVPVAVRAENLAGRIEAWLIDGHARLLLAASTAGIGFGVGKVMLFERSTFDRIGGIMALRHTLAEDTALSRTLARHGLGTAFSHETVAQEIGARSFRAIYDRQVRWSVIRRANEKFSFPLEPLASPLPAALAALLAAPLVDVPAWIGFVGTLVGWFLVETGFAALKRWEISLIAPVAFIGREILALAAWLRAWRSYEVVWADRRFDARQGPSAASPPLGTP
jgi:ceramide glucosyltransferase